MALTKLEVQEKVGSIITEQLGTFDNIGPESKLVEDLNADSLDCVELMVDLEDSFNIEIDDEQAARLVTVGDICNYIAEKTGAE